ncbi:MAG: ABC transporter permease [Acetatifactor sp.]|nr:ABC transporter permease [Acetatifactor sp.]
MIKFFIEEIRFIIKHNVKSTVLLICISAIGTLCIGMSFYMYLQSNTQIANYKETYKDWQMYSVMDTFDDIYLKDEKNTPKFKKFLECLNNDEHFDYYMMYDQPVYWEDYKGEESNINGYEHKSDISSMTQKITDKNGIERESTCLKGFWLGRNVFDLFQIQLSQGRGFEQEDYTLTPSGRISIILGSNYRNQYKVGDRVFISFVFAEREAEIVGFMEEGSNVFYRDRFINLDRYVIMPIFENDDYEGQTIFNFSTNYFYVLRNSGLIVTKLSKKGIESIISKYTKDTGLEDKYYITGEDQNEKEAFDEGIELIQFILSILVALTGIACFVLNTYVTTQSVKKMHRYYFVLMNNGCSALDVSVLIINEIGIKLLISVVIDVAIFTFIMKMNHFYMTEIYVIMLSWMIINQLFITWIAIKSFLNNRWKH